MSGNTTVQPDFFETGLAGVLRVVSAQAHAPQTEIDTTGDLNRFNEPRATHRNSSSSYLGTVNLRRDRCSIILGLFQDNPARAFTDREVLARIYPGSSDMNLVRPRINDLLYPEYGEPLLIEVGDVKCTVTGKTVRACRLNNRSSVPPAAAGGG